ncbi:MAG: Golgi Transport [Thelocarpon impressellum]|nr:MAG: Golgi Transport [Thelocarpon impressellum]
MSGISSMWLSDTQKFGVAFCSGGGFFLVGGVLMFFDRAMLAMGNILLLLGLTLIIGPQKTVLFFARPAKLKGTAAFASGIVLILLRWPLLGFLVELYGLFILFGDFLGTTAYWLAGWARSVPVVGPWVGRLAEAIGGLTTRRNAELPV